MIVQPREGCLRLIRQHDHAMAAGQLAHAWRAGGEPLPFRLVTAVGLHDVAWRELDAEVRYDPSTGRPHDFSSYPIEAKLRAYRSGLDEMEAVDPWVGLLGSLHYASFLEDERAPGFLASERERQARLRDTLRRRSAGDLRGRLERHLRWLKFFDGLSLRLCFAPPAAVDRELPSWLDRGAALTPPEGEEIVPRWRSGCRVEIPGAPLPSAVELRIPARDLSGRRFADSGALERAWRAASGLTWHLEVLPGS